MTKIFTEYDEIYHVTISFFIFFPIPFISWYLYPWYQCGISVLDHCEQHCKSISMTSLKKYRISIWLFASLWWNTLICRVYYSKTDRSCLVIWSMYQCYFKENLLRHNIYILRCKNTYIDRGFIHIAHPSYWSDILQLQVLLGIQSMQLEFAILFLIYSKDIFGIFATYRLTYVQILIYLWCTDIGLMLTGRFISQAQIPAMLFDTEWHYRCMPIPIRITLEHKNIGKGCFTAVM